MSGAFIYFGATQTLETRVRKQVSRWVAIYAFFIITASLYVGAYVLSFFGISLPVLQVAGGIVIAISGWKMLSGPDAATAQRRSETENALPIHMSPSRLAFYPLTMPLTTGPGTISVAISLGANRPNGMGEALLAFLFQTVLATALLCLVVFIFYRHSGRLARAIGATGTAIIVRLSAFLLFCIGIQMLWKGTSLLLIDLWHSL